jgi:hypothetical protein
MSNDPELLRDEIALLLASIDDARAEHAAGDLDGASFAEVVGRDEARLADARERLARLTLPPTTSVASVHGSEGHRRVRLLAVSAACVVLAVAVGVLAATDPFAPARRPPRITTSLKVVGLLIVGEKAVASNEPLRALTAYDAVLRLDPNEPEALIESGWLRYEEGLAQHRPGWVRAGASTLSRAVVVAPNDAAAHLYDGIVLYQYDKDHRAALAQLLRAGDLPESQFEQSVTGTFLALLEPKR